MDDVRYYNKGGLKIEKKIPNRPNKLIMILYPILFIYFIIMGLILFSIGYRDGGIASISIGLLSSIPVFYMEVVRKPNFVHLNENNIQLIFRFGKTIEIPYSEIRWVTIPRQTVWGEGTLAVNHRFRFRMEYSACKLIRDAYAEKIGVFPPGDPFDK